MARAADVAQFTKLEKPPIGREAVPAQLSRLAEAHEHILVQARAAGEGGDEGNERSADQ